MSAKDELIVYSKDISSPKRFDRILPNIKYFQQMPVKEELDIESEIVQSGYFTVEGYTGLLVEAIELFRQVRANNHKLISAVQKFRVGSRELPYAKQCLPGT